MHSSTDNNRVEFVLDGDDYFARFLANLQAVRDAAPAANTYVRLAYWWISPTCNLGGPGTPPTLVDSLKEVADRGHWIQIIAWKPAVLDIKVSELGGDTMAKDNDAQHEQLKTILDGYAGNGAHSGGNIRVYLEKYDGWWGSSTHQKIAIFSIAGVLTVLVGGLNLSDHYYGDVLHQNGLWHDTAVAIRGPAAVEVEKEWLRRWNKSWTQVKGINSQIPVYGGILKSIVGSVMGSTAKTKDQPVEAGSPVTVDIRTTNAEGYLVRETDIQDRLLAEIKKATNYVYFENFTFFDPSLVRALHDRLVTRPTLKVIIVVPTPGGSPSSYLDYIAFTKIALATCTSVTAGTTTVARSACSSWSISESMNFSNSIRSYTSTISNNWMQDDTLSYVLNGTWGTKTIKLTDLTAITGGTRFYTARIGNTGDVVYTHSKLALFDDSVAMIGTANYNYRSQVFDGEISAFISGNGAVVSGIRQTLFTHYNMRTYQNWDGDVDTPRGLPGRSRIHRLELNDFPTRAPDLTGWGKLAKLNFTIL